MVASSAQVVTLLDLPMVPRQLYTQGTLITGLVLPEVTGSTAPLTYTLTAADGQGLAFRLSPSYGPSR